jgi:hypothetical protein
LNPRQTLGLLAKKGSSRVYVGRILALNVLKPFVYAISRSLKRASKTPGKLKGKFLTNAIYNIAEKGISMVPLRDCDLHVLNIPIERLGKCIDIESPLWIASLRRVLSAARK